MPKTAAQLGITEPSGGFQEGGFFQGREFVGGTFSEPGQLHPNSPRKGFEGTRVSSEVIAQTNPANVGFIESQISAENIGQAPQLNLPSDSATGAGVDSLQTGVDKARLALEGDLGARKTEIDERMKLLREKETAALAEVETLTTPFREELEATQREKLFVTKNFEENQKLVDQLDQLLTEGNELIRQQKEVTGLSAVRNPRIQRSINDVAARAGVIEAVISARNGQIGQANNLIDRSVAAIVDDRKDQLTYYETILNLNNRDILSLDDDSKQIAKEQVDLLKGDLTRAQETQDYVKQLMIDPATAGLMGEAGVSLTDSVRDINRKLAQAQYTREVSEMTNQVAVEGGQVVVDPTSVPEGQLITLTDSRGQVRHYKVPVGSSLASGGPGGKVGSVASRIESASQQNLSYLDFVKTYAGTGMTLGDIREAYDKSPRGQQFGPPKEDPLEIRAIFAVFSGELSEADARRQFGIGE